MTLTPEAEARIDDRIRRLSRRPGAAAARAELRDHVADAAEGLAGSKAATSAHVDAAFDALGSKEQIRSAFFPTVGRHPVDRWTLGVLVLAAIASALVGIINDGGVASCEVTGPGTCRAETRGDAADVAILVSLPLIVLAALLWLPPWVGVAAASLVLLFHGSRSLDAYTDTEQSAFSLLLLALSGIATFAAAIRHLRQHRKSPHA